MMIRYDDRLLFELPDGYSHLWTKTDDGIQKLNIISLHKDGEPNWSFSVVTASCNEQSSLIDRCKLLEPVICTNLGDDPEAVFYAYVTPPGEQLCGIAVAGIFVKKSSEEIYVLNTIVLCEESEYETALAFAIEKTKQMTSFAQIDGKPLKVEAIVEGERKRAEAAEATRKADEERRQAEAAEAARIAEEERKQAETAEVAHKAEEDRKQAKAAEAARKAEEERKQAEAAEAARRAEEELRQAESDEAARKVEEKRKRAADIAWQETLNSLGTATPAYQPKAASDRLNSVKKKAEAAVDPIAEERRRLLNERKRQQRIVENNKGLFALFGKRARRRKAAQAKIEQINKELARIKREKQPQQST